MDYSVVLFDLKTEGAPSEKPLMLQPVLFCPVLAWVCQELRACGAQRFFAVCDADAREEVLAAAEGFDLTCVDSAEEALAQVQGGVIAVPGAVVPAAGEPSRAVYAADAGELRARLGEGRTLADCPAEAAGIRDRVKIMVGGAPVTEAFCRRIGADAYTPDAATAAEIAVQLCS